MRYRISVDPFHKKYPAPSFREELASPYHKEKPPHFGSRPRKDFEISLEAVNIRADFPDPDGLLDSAYADLASFFRVYGVRTDEGGVPIYTQICDTSCREAYKISVFSDRVVLSANDTEGIRRAIYYIEDEIKKAGGPYLPIGEISRTPFVKSRISKCFFAPPSHASSEGTVNELASDIDYYPEEYLNRLAHDGVNGLWIGASLHDLLESDVIPEYGKDSARRLKKLRETVLRCRRYGIGVYLLSVEPASGYNNPAFEAHPEYHGAKGWADYHLFCPSNEGCFDYIRGAMKRLFSAVPELAGFINISTGEALSACGSDMSLKCPRCKKKYGTLAATLAATEKVFADAIREVASNAEFISWTYSQRVWEREDVIASCEARDRSVIHMQNFEDFGVTKQLGEDRYAFDYWLSYVGPGEVMADSLKVNKKRGVRTYAKLQVCSSHEITTVPYIPTPGILYDKFKVMHDEGISGAVMCWYFGSYPCLMSRAACELSFEPFPKDRERFLLDTARLYWGDDASAAASAYSLFEEGYRNYPVSQSFEWFGPMQDSPVAPLHLLPKDLPMPSTWLTENMVGGDRIGECLLDGHTPSEAISLTSLMAEKWKAGVQILDTLPDLSYYIRAEQVSVCRAVGLLFESGNNILAFYELRHRLGIGEGDARELLSEMKKIVIREMDISRELSALCEGDPRLGYHPEAHGYKYFPEKLRWRIDELEKLLETEFCEVEKRIENGLAPLGFYVGEGDGRVIREGESEPFYPEGSFRYSDGTVCSFGDLYADNSLGSCGGEPEFNCRLAEEYFTSPKTYIEYSEKDGRITLKLTLYEGVGDSLHIRPEFHLFHPSAHIYLKDGALHIPEQKNYSMLRGRLDKRRAAFECRYSEATPEDVSHLFTSSTAIYEISFDRSALGMSECEPFRLAVRREGRHIEELEPADRKYSRLIQGDYSPDSFVLFLK
ncbi:MAG: hypothetical protein IJE25_06055 [Clostridia bacterium]|nr:hypothetical protein [Clostridia bacterium]